MRFLWTYHAHVLLYYTLMCPCTLTSTDSSPVFTIFNQTKPAKGLRLDKGTILLERGHAIPIASAQSSPVEGCKEKRGLSKQNQRLDGEEMSSRITLRNKEKHRTAKNTINVRRKPRSLKKNSASSKGNVFFTALNSKSQGSISAFESGTDFHCPFPGGFGSFSISGRTATRSKGGFIKNPRVVVLSANHPDCKGLSFDCPSKHNLRHNGSKIKKGKKYMNRNLKGKKKLNLFKSFKPMPVAVRNPYIVSNKKGSKHTGSLRNGASASMRIYLPEDHPSCNLAVTPAPMRRFTPTPMYAPSPVGGNIDMPPAPKPMPTPMPTPKPTPKPTPMPTPMPSPIPTSMCNESNNGKSCKEGAVGQGICQEKMCVECVPSEDRKYCSEDACTDSSPSIDVDVKKNSGETRLVTRFLNKDEPQVDVTYDVDKYKTGSLNIPPGFTASFSTDDGKSFRDVEPLSGITNLRVQGVLPPNPGASLELPAPVAESISQVSDLGDGFAPLILGRRVYYMNHQESNPPLLCTLMDKQPDVQDTDCPGFPYYVSDYLGRSYYSGDAPVGYADRDNNRIYIPVNPDQIVNAVGVLCIHIPNNSGDPELCPANGQVASKEGDITFTTDGLVEFKTVGDGLNEFKKDGSINENCDAGFGFADQAAERLYFSHIYQRTMYCLSVADPDAPAPCKKIFPIDVSNVVAPVARIRMTVMPKTDRFIMKALGRDDTLVLQCWENPLDPAVEARICDGWTNDTIKLDDGRSYQYESIPIPNDIGIAIGFCVWPDDVSSLPTCFHLDSGEVATDGVLGDAAQQLWDNGPLANGIYNLPSTRYGSLSFYETRVYFSMGNLGDVGDRLGCYDGETGKKCENYGYTFPGREDEDNDLDLYGLMVDVGSDGECVWALGDAGILVSFNAFDPSKECGSDKPMVYISADEAYCDQNSKPRKWFNVTLLDGSSQNGDFVEANLTVFNADEMEVIPATPIDEGTAVDLSFLPVSDSTSTLSFQVEFSNAADGLFERDDPPRISVQWEGPPPQVCFVSRSVGTIETVLDVCYDEVPEEDQVDCSLPVCPDD